MSEIRVAAIHQPNFLPWLGFFQKMASTDVFILLDNVPYSKNSYQNRVKIKSAQGEQWLTVPVLTKGRSGQLTCEVLINNAIGWQKKHLAALRTNYQRASAFEQVLTWLEPLYSETYTKLAIFNRALIEAVVHQLKLPVRLVNASSLTSDGSGAGLLLQLVQAVGCAVYLSGPSGRDYLDTSIFRRAGVEVRFQQFQHPVYPQLYGDFIPGLSILDLLMNVEPYATEGYLKGCSDPLYDAKEEHDQAMISQTGPRVRDA
jgi:hypothetical protein